MCETQLNKVSHLLNLVKWLSALSHTLNLQLRTTRTPILSWGILYYSLTLHRCNVLHCTGQKSKRAIRSVLGEELYAFAGIFDFAFTLSNDFKSNLDHTIPFEVYTDPKRLFDVITKSTATTEEKIMIEIVRYKMFTSKKRYHLLN